MEKLLTLIIPIYNTQEYLPKCLNSLLVKEELLSALEILLIIDGSPDNSINIAKEFEEKYPDTFRVIDKPNGGYGSVLSRGIKEAQGKYCKILDSDDWYDNSSFNQFLEELKTIDTDVVVTDYVREYVFENRSELLTLPNTKAHHIYDLDEDISNLDKDVFVMHRLAYKTEILKQSQIDFPEKIFYTDTLFAAIPLFFAKSLVYINTPLYRYFIGRDGQTVSPEVVKKNRKGVEIVIKYYYQKYTQHRDLFSTKKKEYVLNSLKVLIHMYYRILIHLPYSDAQRELKEWHHFIKNTPEYQFFADNKMIKYYDLLPYFIFRYSSKLWSKN